MPAWMATRSAARPCHKGEYFSLARSAAALAAFAARTRTTSARQRRFSMGAADEPLFPSWRWEVARTGTELMPLAPAAPMNTDTARKANAMSAIRGCLRILLLLGVSETPVGSRWDALMRAGRLLHTTRDTVPEGLAGSGRLSIPTRCRRDSPCLLCSRDSFSLRDGTQVGTSGAVVASSARRRRGTELCLRGGWASPRPGNHKPGASAPFVVDSWCARNHIHPQALGASAKSLEDGHYRQLRCRQDVN